ncbi:MAG: type III pantothenate kinase [Marinilabiliales bacterium]|nr:type III pantothenate kinase [Marinilabiliales bacterium]
MVHLLTWQSRPSFRINYQTPDTLGVDRLAATAGAMLHHPGASLLVIDAGSALTIDVMADETYLGGSISPGLSMAIPGPPRVHRPAATGRARQEVHIPRGNQQEMQ